MSTRCRVCATSPWPAPRWPTEPRQCRRPRLPPGCDAFQRFRAAAVRRQLTAGPGVAHHQQEHRLLGSRPAAQLVKKADRVGRVRQRRGAGLVQHGDQTAAGDAHRSGHVVVAEAGAVGPRAVLLRKGRSAPAPLPGRACSGRCQVAIARPATLAARSCCARRTRNPRWASSAWACFATVTAAVRLSTRRSAVWVPSVAASTSVRCRQGATVSTPWNGLRRNPGAPAQSAWTAAETGR